VFAISALTLLAVILADHDSAGVGAIASSLTGAGLIGLFVAVSFVPGRGLRE
jgi:hypothetical protein